MARIISFISRKGGSGKTTTAANVAAALAKRGRKVLVMDLDPQQSLSKSLAGPSILDGKFIEPQADLDQQLNLLWKDPQVFQADYLLIDCPPSLDDIAIAAAYVSHLVVIPTGTSRMDLMATGETLTAVRQIRDRRKGVHPVIAIQPTRVQPGTGVSKTIEAELPELLLEGEQDQATPGWALVLPTIALRTIFAQSFDFSETAMDSEPPSSKAAQEINRVTDRIETILMPMEKYHDLEPKKGDSEHG